MHRLACLQQTAVADDYEIVRAEPGDHLDARGPFHARLDFAIGNHAVNNWEHQALNYSRQRTGLPPIQLF